MIRPAALCLAILAGAAMAEAPETSLKPVARAAPSPGTDAAARGEWFLSTMSASAIPFSLRPPLRPEAIPAMARRQQEELRRGMVCGHPDIQGDRIGSVPGAGACGVADAVRVRSVSGVRLSTPAILDCRTADALRRWVDRGLRPAVGDEGGGVASIRVAAHYACRTRNNRPGARLSEHAFGRAIDIAGIGLRDGSEMTVLTDWNSRADGRQLRRMHRAACGIFGTVLGPEANAAHRDHFHFDTARYRSGAYCR